MFYDYIAAPLSNLLGKLVTSIFYNSASFSGDFSHSFSNETCAIPGQNVSGAICPVNNQTAIFILEENCSNSYNSTFLSQCMEVCYACCEAVEKLLATMVNYTQCYIPPPPPTDDDFTPPPSNDDFMPPLDDDNDNLIPVSRGGGQSNEGLTWSLIGIGSTLLVFSLAFYRQTYKPRGINFPNILGFGLTAIAGVAFISGGVGVKKGPSAAGYTVLTGGVVLLSASSHLLWRGLKQSYSAVGLMNQPAARLAVPLLHMA